MEANMRKITKVLLAMLLACFTTIGLAACNFKLPFFGGSSSSEQQSSSSASSEAPADESESESEAESEDKTSSEASSEEPDDSSSAVPPASSEEPDDSSSEVPPASSEVSSESSEEPEPEVPVGIVTSEDMGLIEVGAQDSINIADFDEAYTIKKLFKTGAGIEIELDVELSGDTLSLEGLNGEYAVGAFDAEGNGHKIYFDVYDPEAEFEWNVISEDTLTL